MVDYLRAMIVTRMRSERGASAVEYGLLVAGVAVAMIVSVEVLGLTLGAIFHEQNSRIETP